jgi:hypothetical protein
VAETHEVVGLFRDRGQARLAVAAARRKGLDVGSPDDLPEDASGVHVVLRTTGAPEDARVLLLTYGAYSASAC